MSITKEEFNELMRLHQEVVRASIREEKARRYRCECEIEFYGFARKLVIPDTATDTK